jgi:cation-transporting P-type ATPase E
MIKLKNVERYNPNIEIGLTTDQVKKRIEEDLVNHDTTIPTKSIKRIIYENFFTLFNIINIILAICILCVKSYKNMLFLLIVIINTAISTIQEIHSKKVVDKLSIVASPKAKVIRNGKTEIIDIHQLVLDDIIILKTGEQIAADCKILSNEVEVNESCITGETNTIRKKVGDILLSGSYIVSGNTTAKIEHIGEENYTAQISSGAKYVKKIKSEIMTSLDKIIKILTFAIIPIGLLFFANQLHIPGNTYKTAVIKSVAAIIGMIPEGLVLLTSTVLAVSVIRLSKSNVLVQELYCIETLARVDTLCLDKTGTLTEGSLQVEKIIATMSSQQENLKTILQLFAKFSPDSNTTIEAIRDFCNITNNINENYQLDHAVPFSSEKKWSGISLKNKGSYVLGAPEFVLKKQFNKYKNEILSYQENYRVLAIAHSNNKFENNDLPQNLELLGFVLVSDKIRKDAKKTLEYFKNQGVNIKIISGDNPVTVSKIGKQVGLENYDKYIDMSTIKDCDIDKIVENHTIFGRVSPIQKKLIIEALQSNGKTVAMTGDGVNDVLALKTSDCSIAMANGSDAAKNVSQLILLDSNFSSMPKIVAEGRRTINNIERSASLFLVKTIYSCLNAILFLLIGEPYPFEPIQLSLISTVTIGIPSFVLALEPNKERIKGNFLRNVISKSLPTALCVTTNIFAITILKKYNILTASESSTLCIISTGTLGLLLLFTLAKSRKSENSKLPFSPFRLTLALLMIALFICCLTIFNWWFDITDLHYLFDKILPLSIMCIFNYLILNFLFSHTKF